MLHIARGRESIWLLIGSPSRAAQTRGTPGMTGRIALSLRVDHVFGAHDRIEFLSRDESGLQRFLAQSGAVLVRRLGDLRGIVVADFRRQSCDQHERALDARL